MTTWAKLILAIIAVESGGDDRAIGDNGRAVGCMQIHAICIEDVNRVYGTSYRWPEDALDCETSKRIFRLYTTYWAEVKFDRLPTAEEAARIWNGGPRGNEKEATLNYWNDVKRELERN